MNILFKIRGKSSLIGRGFGNGIVKGPAMTAQAILPGARPDLGNPGTAPVPVANPRRRPDVAAGRCGPQHRPARAALPGGVDEKTDLAGSIVFWVVRQKTSKSRFKRALLRVKEWCRANRHLPVREQQVVLSQKLRGHYGYYGVTGSSMCLGRFRNEVGTLWKKWLSRRSQRAFLDWPAFNRLLRRYPLPVPRIVRPAMLNVANP